jgi:hypothetical protein
MSEEDILRLNKIGADILMAKGSNYSNCVRGRYKPKNPAKYRGDISKIEYRSSWELRVQKYFDEHPGIIWWSSEEVIIPYKDPVSGRARRYYPDFVVKIRKEDNSTETLMIEVKPQYQVDGPQKQKRKTKKYINEVYTYAVNQAKWKAAKEYCSDRLWKFTILTENDMGIKP